MCFAILGFPLFFLQGCASQPSGFLRFFERVRLQPSQNLRKSRGSEAQPFNHSNETNDCKSFIKNICRWVLVGRLKFDSKREISRAPGETGCRGPHVVILGVGPPQIENMSNLVRLGSPRLSSRAPGVDIFQVIVRVPGPWGA